MIREEQKPLLTRNKHTNYGINQQQPSINGSNSESIKNTSITIEENKWTKCTSRYQGKTEKKEMKITIENIKLKL